MKSTLSVSLREIYLYCRDFCKDQERWPSYYLRRYLEFLSYYELFPIPTPERVLELGCGNGYQSAFLSKIAKEVVATDLPHEDLSTHTPGMKVAIDLHKRLDISNVTLIPCSAESLPFEDDSFDMVYSSHVLEHIPDQAKALNEIFRVLKPGGYHFCVVPTTTEKVYAFFNFHIYLVSHSIKRFYQWITPRESASGPAGDEGKPRSTTNNAKSLLRYFPFPPPHGHTSHYLRELVSWTPSSWARRIVKSAPFIIDNQSTTQLNPLLSWLGYLAPMKATNLHRITRKLELKMGAWPVFRSLGINTVMVCRKPK